MHEVHSQVQPFNTESGCGDFVVTLDRDDGLLISLGDVAGHGEPDVGGLARKLVAYLKEHSAEPLPTLLEGLRSIPGVSERGVSLFLGLLDNQLPLLHYYLLGDIRAYRLKDGDASTLVSHEGPLGISPPELTRFHSLKAHPLETFIIHSDGIASATVSLLPSNAMALKPAELLQEILKLGRNSADDAACVLFRCSSGSHSLERLPRTTSTIKPSETLKASSAAEPVQLPSTRPSLPFHKLSDHEKLASITSAPEARLFCTLLFEVVELDNYQQARLESYLLEALHQGCRSIETFADNLRLQLQLPYSAQTARLGESLFGREAINTSAHLITVTLATSTQLDSPTRVRLGHLMSEQNYTQYADRRRRDELLAQQAKLAAMGEMIGAIAHQWRQPLNELGLRVQQLQLHQHKAGLNTDEVDQYAADSLQLITHMADTIDDFRDFFSNKQESKTFDVAQVVQDVHRLQSAQLKNNSIEFRSSGESFEVRGHASYLKQVLFNLISNSKDAFKERGTVVPRIELSLDPSTRTLTLKDNGGGVEEDFLHRIYEPYYTMKPHGKGTGLGLYMSRMLMIDHLHGTINSSNWHTGNESGLITELKFSAAKESS